MMKTLSSLTPTQIVTELDRYIVGQKDAKKAVAIALRNRWRRLQLSDALRAEILPKTSSWSALQGSEKRRSPAALLSW